MPDDNEDNELSKVEESAAALAMRELEQEMRSAKRWGAGIAIGYLAFLAYIFIRLDRMNILTKLLG